MNAHLTERIHPGSHHNRGGHDQGANSQQRQRINPAIGKYYDDWRHDETPPWALRSEVPTIEEILGPASTMRVEALKQELANPRFTPVRPVRHRKVDAPEPPRPTDVLDGTSAPVQEDATEAFDPDADLLLSEGDETAHSKNIANHDATNATADTAESAHDTSFTADDATNGPAANDQPSWDSAPAEAWNDTANNDSWASSGGGNNDQTPSWDTTGSTETPAWDNSGGNNDAWGHADGSANDSWDNPSNNEGWGSAVTTHDDPWSGWDANGGKSSAADDVPWGESTNPENHNDVAWGDADIPKDENGLDDLRNVIEGPWDSVDDYLKNHYLLLREDAMREFRRGIEYVTENSGIVKEDNTVNTLGIYDQVRVSGITFDPFGIAIRVSFSLSKVGKKVKWDQSRRLQKGSIVVLMNLDKTEYKVATVAARPLDNLMKNPPEVDLFFSNPSKDLDLDCTQEWVMIEEMSGFFESQRHTLTALQRMTTESFPLKDHLVSLDESITAPAYIEASPSLDVSSVFPDSRDNVNVLGELPTNEDLLDQSQNAALQTILGRRLAIVQGPPGTGKTHVSVEALKILLSNMRESDPPIIITCQTNHALDQILRHVAAFETRFARVGGRSTDEIVLTRTVFELKSPILTSLPRWNQQNRFRKLAEELAEVVMPLQKTEKGKFHTISAEVLREHYIISAEQFESLKEGEKKYIVTSQDPLLTSATMKWLRTSQLEPASAQTSAFLASWAFEEPERDMEETGEDEAEIKAQEAQDEIERLKGPFIEIGDVHRGRSPDPRNMTARAIKLLEENDDLHNIPKNERGMVYRYFQRLLKASISAKLRERAEEYNALVKSRYINRQESSEIVLKEQKVIGMTTTGLSKYRGLVSALQPRVVLIEEAAETMEAPVIAACVPSLEHLILVGDHQQLRPNPSSNYLSRAPYHLDISMFERLVTNGIPFSMLRRQRRMKPEIRRMLKPIYGDVIRDHPVVKSTAIVPGLGGLAAWLYTHEQLESRDNDLSTYNLHEVEMIFGFAQYLIYNMVPPENITVLTFYRAQVRHLSAKLRKYTPAKGVKVITVDAYQGEENDVVILSLVRSNLEGKIGFVKNDNRICVALSRAKLGCYVFGNAKFLAQQSRTWADLIFDLHTGRVGKRNAEIKSAASNGCKPAKLNKHLPDQRIGFYLPLWCSRHQRMTFIQSEQDWRQNVGGCTFPCGGTLICGHVCPEACHPWEHFEGYQGCKKKCTVVMPCGHACSQKCCDRPHSCFPCDKAMLDRVTRQSNKVPDATNYDPDSDDRDSQVDPNGADYGDKPAVMLGRATARSTSTALRGNAEPAQQSEAEHFDAVYNAQEHASATNAQQERESQDWMEEMINNGPQPAQTSAPEPPVVHPRMFVSGPTTTTQAGSFIPRPQSNASMKSASSRGAPSVSTEVSSHVSRRSTAQRSQGHGAQPQVPAVPQAAPVSRSPPPFNSLVNYDDVDLLGDEGEQSEYVASPSGRATAREELSLLD